MSKYQFVIGGIIEDRKKCECIKYAGKYSHMTFIEEDMISAIEDEFGDHFKLKNINAKLVKKK